MKYSLETYINTIYSMPLTQSFLAILLPMSNVLLTLASVSLVLNQVTMFPETFVVCFGLVRIVLTDRNQFIRTTQSNAMRFKPNETRTSGYTKRMRPLMTIEFALTDVDT